MSGRRHHFIPRLILRNFADESGALWFWRHGAKGDVGRTTPENLFHERDLYSQIELDGTRDAAVDDMFTKLEDLAAPFMAQLLPIVRARRIPALDEGAWSFFFHYTYYSIKRVPAYARKLAESGEYVEVLRRALQDAVANDPTRAEEAAEILGDPEEIERLARNGLILAQGRKPIEELGAEFERKGMLVLLAPPGKSFIIGEVPFAKVEFGPTTRDAPDDRISFFPVAHDVALGFLGERRKVQLEVVPREYVRRMNEAVAAQSRMFAGRNQALVSSLSRAVSYTGVKINLPADVDTPS